MADKTETKKAPAAKTETGPTKEELAEAKKTNELNRSLDEWFARQVAGGLSGDEIKAALDKWEPTGAVGLKESKTDTQAGHYAVAVEPVAGK